MARNGKIMTLAATKTTALSRSDPESEGISSSAILSFIEAADATLRSLHSFMLVRHGHVVAEGWWTPYAPQFRHSMFSLSKSFASTAIGLAIAEGRLSIHDTVLGFFPEDAPSRQSDNLKAMRVRDLLIMSSGQSAEDIQSLSLDSNEPLTRKFLEMPVPHKPGSFFFYNTPATYMLSAIVQKLTGETLLDYLTPRLFEPLGIENPTWDASAQGISLGGYGLSIRTEDIARFGQLYLNQGKWQGKQLIPAQWIADATVRQASNGSNPNSDWDQGYGYQFWRCRHNLYRGDGAFGQNCIVMPQHDAVIVTTAGGDDLGAILNLIWTRLLPAMQSKPLPADASAVETLNAKLAALTLPAQDGLAHSTGATSRRFVFPPNEQKIESIKLNGSRLSIRCDGVDSTIECGHGTWTRGNCTFTSDILRKPMSQSVAASGAWVTGDTYRARIVFYETPFAATLTMQFLENRLILGIEYNVVRKGSTKLPQLVAIAEISR
jgi:CubicO group peptidase (beta-lactamase class C family)